MNFHKVQIVCQKNVILIIISGINLVKKYNEDDHNKYSTNPLSLVNNKSF